MLFVRHLLVLKCLNEFRIDVVSGHIREVIKVQNPHRHNNKATVVVSFNSKTTRQNVLKQFREKVGRENSSGIRMYEHLSRARKTLLWETRERAKNYDWAFVWIHDGNILARRAEGEKIVRITSVKDMDKIGG